jgi:hypothetical protein
LEDTTLATYSGGIAGSNPGLIENCYSTGNISATSSRPNDFGSPALITYAGGITGNNTGTINKCWTSGAISATVPTATDMGAAAGGIVGAGTASNCVALTTSVTASTNGYTAYAGRVSGTNSTGTNYVNSTMVVQTIVAGTTATGTLNGLTFAAGSAGTQSWWTTPGWTINAAGTGSDSSPWEWNTATSRPKLWFE